MTQRLVLVVDDNEDVRLIAKTILESRGFAVAQAADGAEAVEIARLHHPDLIFLDLIMPGVDGWEVMALLQLDRRSERIPVVAITSSEPSPEKLQQAGFCALLAKPFLPADLVSAVQICLDGRSRGELWIPDLARQIAAG